MNTPTPYNSDAATETLPAYAPLTAHDGDHPELPAAAAPEEEPFVPRKRYTPGRITKILVCVLLVVAGFFGGTLVQKQLDQGARAGRGNVGNFQGTNGRTGGNSATQGPGQGRRGGNNAATAPAATAPAAAPTGAAGQ